MSFFAHLIAGPIVRSADLIPPPDTPAEDQPRGRLTWASSPIILSSARRPVQKDRHRIGAGHRPGRSSRFDPASRIDIDLIPPRHLRLCGPEDGLPTSPPGATWPSAWPPCSAVASPPMFDQPYRASFPQDFTRPLLYQPVGLAARLSLHSAGQLPRQCLVSICRNLMITMVLGGLWRRAAWKFATWKPCTGVVLCLERLWTTIRARSPTGVGAEGLRPDHHLRRGLPGLDLLPRR